MSNGLSVLKMKRRAVQSDLDELTQDVGNDEMKWEYIHRLQDELKVLDAKIAALEAKRDSK